MYQFYDDVDFSTSAVPQSDYRVQNQQTQTIRYECSKCDSLFTSRMYLHQHEATQHSRLFHCPFCPALFSNKPDYRVHVTAHSEKKYLPCAFCRKIFYEIDDYTAHVKQHREPLMFSCEKCPALFSQLSLLRVHNATHLTKKFVHTIPKIYSCPRKEFSKMILEEEHNSDDTAFTNSKDRITSTAVGSETIDLDDAPGAVLPVSSTTTVITIKEASTSASTGNDDEVEIISEQNLAVADPVRKHCRSKGEKLDVTSENNSLVLDDHSKDQNVRKRRYPRKGKLEKNVIVPNPSRKQNQREHDRPIGKKYKNIAPVAPLLTTARLVSSSRVSLCPTAKKTHDAKQLTIKLKKKSTKRYNLRKNRVETDNTSARLISTSSGNSYVDSNEKRSLRPRNNNLKNTIAGNADVNVVSNYNFRDGLQTKSSIVTSSTSDKKQSNRKNSCQGFFMCLSCKRVFLTYSALTQHKNLHIENRGFRCEECGGVFGGVGNLVTHQRSGHKI